MNQVEASPTNRGNNGKYEAAGALIAYGCSLALENPNPSYHGALGLTSKTELIPLYKNKYFADLYPERRMLIEPAYGQILITSYL